MKNLSRADLDEIQRRVDEEYPIASLRLDVDHLIEIARAAYEAARDRVRMQDEIKKLAGRWAESSSPLMSKVNDLERSIDRLRALFDLNEE